MIKQRLRLQGSTEPRSKEMFGRKDPKEGKVAMSRKNILFIICIYLYIYISIYIYIYSAPLPKGEGGASAWDADMKLK